MHCMCSLHDSTNIWPTNRSSWSEVHACSGVSKTQSDSLTVQQTDREAELFKKRLCKPHKQKRSVMYWSSYGFYFFWLGFAVHTHTCAYTHSLFTGIICCGSRLCNVVFSYGQDRFLLIPVQFQNLPLYSHYRSCGFQLHCTKQSDDSLASLMIHKYILFYYVILQARDV